MKLEEIEYEKRLKETCLETKGISTSMALSQVHPQGRGVSRYQRQSHSQGRKVCIYQGIRDNLTLKGEEREESEEEEASPHGCFSSQPDLLS